VLVLCMVVNSDTRVFVSVVVLPEAQDCGTCLGALWKDEEYELLGVDEKEYENLQTVRFELASC